METVEIRSVSGETIRIGPGCPLLLIAGPCVLESEAAAMETAAALKSIALDLGIPFIFKSSFDKANRSAIDSFRGPGIQEGLQILGRIREEIAVPVISDIHSVDQVEPAAEILDILQIPAFLCRQTDLLTAVAKSGKPVNLKKGQFMSPWDMKNAVEKIRSAGNRQLLLTERGFALGYNNLVVDMRSLPIMRSLGCPVIFDATHSVQLPGGAGNSSGGQREFVGTLARAAVGAGIDGIFIEVHPDPDNALCDGPNSIALDNVAPLLSSLLEIHAAVSKNL